MTFKVIWDNKQIERIRAAVKTGRAAMTKRSADPLVFADAFIKAGGVQVPGMPAVDEGTLLRIGSCKRAAHLVLICARFGTKSTHVFR